MTNYESTPDNDRLATEFIAKTKQSLVFLYVVGFLSLDCLFIVEGRITDEDCYRNIVLAKSKDVRGQLTD